MWGFRTCNDTLSNQTATERGLQELFVLSVQLFYKYKTILKLKAYFKKIAVGKTSTYRIKTYNQICLTPYKKTH